MKPEFLLPLLKGLLGTPSKNKELSVNLFCYIQIGNLISSDRIWPYLKFSKYGRCRERHRDLVNGTKVKLEPVFVYTSLEILFSFFFRTRNAK